MSSGCCSATPGTAPAAANTTVAPEHADPVLLGRDVARPRLVKTEPEAARRRCGSTNAPSRAAGARKRRDEHPGHEPSASVPPHPSRGTTSALRPRLVRATIVYGRHPRREPRRRRATPVPTTAGGQEAPPTPRRQHHRVHAVLPDVIAARASRTPAAHPHLTRGARSARRPTTLMTPAIDHDDEAAGRPVEVAERARDARSARPARATAAPGPRAR